MVFTGIAEAGACTCGALVACSRGVLVRCPAHRLVIAWCQLSGVGSSGSHVGVGGGGGSGSISVLHHLLDRAGLPCCGGGREGSGGRGAFLCGGMTPFLACRPPGADTE